MKRVVVTGAQGFLGRHLVRKLSEQGAHVLAVDQKPLAGERWPGVVYHVSDLSDPETLIPPACEPLSEFTLVHLAWDMRRPEASYRIQMEQTLRLAGLLDTWASRGLRYVVAPGSAQEYGVRSGVLAEDDPPQLPLTPYGCAKRAAFLMADSWSRRTGIGLLWLRPFIVYGPGQAGHMLIPYVVRQMAAGEPARVSDGAQTRDFVFVDDVIEAILRGIEQHPPGSCVVNLGGGEGVRVRDVLQAIADHFGRPGLIEFGAIARRAGEPETQVGNIARAREILGWRPTLSWREGIRRTCAEAEG